jgi:hypothetical protein
LKKTDERRFFSLSASVIVYKTSVKDYLSFVIGECGNGKGKGLGLAVFLDYHGVEAVGL